MTDPDSILSRLEACEKIQDRQTRQIVALRNQLEDLKVFTRCLFSIIGFRACIKRTNNTNKPCGKVRKSRKSHQHRFRSPAEMWETLLK